MAMPTDSSTNSLSMLQMQTEFGGSNPISITEYFRGGTYVPASVLVPDWVNYGYIAGVQGVFWRTVTSGSSTGTVFWAWAFNSAAVSYTAPQLSGSQWQINVGGQYYGYPSTATITSTSSTAADGTTYTDRTTDIQRYEANTTTNYINGSLPSQPSVGDPYPSISFSNFYGTTD